MPPIERIKKDKDYRLAKVLVSYHRQRICVNCKTWQNLQRVGNRIIWIDEVCAAVGQIARLIADCATLDIVGAGLRVMVLSLY